jgi:hypothetical protein
MLWDRTQDPKRSRPFFTHCGAQRGMSYFDHYNLSLVLRTREWPLRWLSLTYLVAASSRSMTESSFRSTMSFPAFSFLSSHVELPSSVTLKGEDFLLIDHTANQRKGPSPRLSQQAEPNPHAWRCEHCNNDWFTVFKNTKTSDALQHLMIIHGARSQFSEGGSDEAEGPS